MCYFIITFKAFSAPYFSPWTSTSFVLVSRQGLSAVKCYFEFSCFHIHYQVILQFTADLYTSFMSLIDSSRIQESSLGFSLKTQFHFLRRVTEELQREGLWMPWKWVSCHSVLQSQDVKMFLTQGRGGRGTGMTPSCIRNCKLFLSTFLDARQKNCEILVLSFHEFWHCGVFFFEMNSSFY